MKLVIATPFYEIKGYSPYILSLMNSVRVLNELKMEWDYYELSGDSYVDRAKNSIIHRFMQSDATHILMIDSDLSWGVDGFLRIIKAGLLGAEVVGGAYPNKHNWATFGAVPIMVDGEPVSEEISGSKLLQMYGIPGGFILYSREAIERTRPNLKKYIDVQVNQTILECFKCDIDADGVRIGEDIYFQLRYRELGGIVWCEPNILFTHYGVKGWEGRFQTHLGEMKQMESDSVSQLFGTHKGETAYIVGKGPSIGNLTPESFGLGPVITLNQAIVKVEELGLQNAVYSMQKDGDAKDEVLPEKATLLVHYHESLNTYTGYRPRYVFDNVNDFGLGVQSPAVMSASMLAKKMGCSKVVYLCCDAAVNGDLRTAVPHNGGRIEIEGEQEQYKRHREWVDNLLLETNMQAEWVIPEGSNDFR